MRRPTRHLLLLPILLLAACADPSGPAASGEPDRSPASLTAIVDFDPSEGMYIEGFVSYLRVTGPDTDIEDEIPFDGKLRVDLPQGGSYTLESWVRPCSANCGNLDAPTDHCSEAIEVPDGASLVVEVLTRATKPCEFTVRSA